MFFFFDADIRWLPANLCLHKGIGSLYFQNRTRWNQLVCIIYKKQVIIEANRDLFEIKFVLMQ